MKGFNEAVERLADNFAQFADQLRDISAAAPQAEVGYGEEPYQDDDDDNVVNLVQNRANDVDDDKVITLRSGELRKVIDAYRKFHRYARTGKIPNQDERYKWGSAVRAVKHLIRQPRR
jgi:hypothetical protein